MKNFVSSFFVWLQIVIIQFLLQVGFHLQWHDLQDFLFTRNIFFFFLATTPVYLLVLLSCFIVSSVSYPKLRESLRFLIVGIFVFYYLANYISFYNNQYFVSCDSLQFFKMNPLLTIRYLLNIEPIETCVFTVVTLALTTGIFLLRLAWKSTDKIFYAAYLVPVLAVFAYFCIVLQKFPVHLLKIEPLAGAIQGCHRQGIVLPKTTVHMGTNPSESPIVSLQDYLPVEAIKKMKKKNVLVVLIESMRPDQLTGFGGSNLFLKNMEALAQRSILFTNTYAQSSHSSYADPAVFSGQYPLRSDHIHFYQKNHQYPRLFIYDILKQAGYSTAIFSSQDEDWGNMDGYMNTARLDTYFHAGNFKGNAYVPSEQKGFIRWIQGDKLAGKIDDRFTVEEAIKWLKSIQGEPFFMYMNLQNSHFPYTIPDDFGCRISCLSTGSLKNVEQLKTRYMDSLMYVDEQLGKVLNYLRDNKLLQNTVVIVTGDNGEGFSEHGFIAHGGQLYREAVHVPLFIYDPEFLSRKDNRPAQHIDVAPTILRLLNLPSHPAFQGVDLLQQDKMEHRARYLVSQSPLAYQYAVVKDDLKLMWTPHRSQIELYNLKKDPQERQNLYKEGSPEGAKLIAFLNQWISAQLNYYNNPQRYLKFYPPHFIEDK